MTPTLVFISALGDDSSAWNSLLDQTALSSFDCRVISVPGSGGLSWAGESMHDVARSVTEFVKTEGPSVLIGHSFGGVIGTIAAEMCDSIVGFVSIEGNLTIADCTFSKVAVETSDFNQWFELVRPKVSQRYADSLIRSDWKAFRSHAAELVELSTGSQIGKRFADLRIPKLMIYGANGYPDETIEFIQTAGLDAMRVEGASHWVQEDAPELTAITIQEFVTK